MPALGDLEVQVMRRIWARREPVTVREVLGDLQRDRNIAYTTVMTVMGNLEKKGWLRRHAEGRAYLYEPLVSAEEYGAALMRQALEASTDRAASRALASLLPLRTGRTAPPLSTPAPAGSPGC